MATLLTGEKTVRFSFDPDRRTLVPNDLDGEVKVSGDCSEVDRLVDLLHNKGVILGLRRHHSRPVRNWDDAD